MGTVNAPKPFSLAEVVELERVVSRRNLGEWLTSALVAIGCVWSATNGRGLLRTVAAAEVALAAVYIAFRLYRDGRTGFDRDERTQSERGRHALVRELRRQAALLDRAASWYVAPVLVGWLGLQLADGLDRGVTRLLVVYVVGSLLTAAVIAWLNSRAARRLAVRAGQLESMRDEPAAR
jgi:hypothetical protein